VGRYPPACCSSRLPVFSLRLLQKVNGAQCQQLSLAVLLAWLKPSYHPRPPSWRRGPPSGFLKAERAPCFTSGPGARYGTASAGIAANGHARPRLPLPPSPLRDHCRMRILSHHQVRRCPIGRSLRSASYHQIDLARLCTYVRALPSAVKGLYTPPHCSFSPHEVCSIDLCRFNRRCPAVHHTPASFWLAVLRQSAELVFGGFPLVAHGGGMPARSGDSWSTGGGGGKPTQKFNQPAAAPRSRFRCYECLR
jgi:hypothetical protein